MGAQADPDEHPPGRARGRLPSIRRRGAQRATRGLRRHPGILDKLGIAADPSHPDHDEIKDWLDDYDPNTFDELQIKIALGRIAKRRNAGHFRLKKPAS